MVETNSALKPERSDASTPHSLGTFSLAELEFVETKQPAGRRYFLKEMANTYPV
jgi:hypothetical protein